MVRKTVKVWVQIQQSKGHDLYSVIIMVWLRGTDSAQAAGQMEHNQVLGCYKMHCLWSENMAQWGVGVTGSTSPTPMGAVQSM